MSMSMSMLCTFLLVGAIAMPNGTGNTVMFAPFLDAPGAVIPSSFLSFTFDWNLNKTSGDAWVNASVGWTLNLTDARLEALAKALAPANLRVGGSFADVAEYSQRFPSGGRNCSSDSKAMHVCLEPERWDLLIAFCQRTGLRLAFDLNIMLGRDQTTGAGAWDSSNARALLEYTRAHHAAWATRANLGFELGNEKEFVLTAAQTAASFVELRAVVDDVFAELEASERPLIIGPSGNMRPDWLTNVLDGLGGPGVIDVVSYHVYPGYGRSLDLPALIPRPAWLDFSHSATRQVQAAVARSQRGADVLSGDLEIWIDETAAAWASGTQGVCNGFLSGFWWLDQLAMSASSGHGAMCRQCLVGGNYSLIEQRSDADGTRIGAMTPNPDYWTAWLWRQLIGGVSNTRTPSTTTMLAVNQVMPYEGDFVPEARMYLACTPPSAPHYKVGAVSAIWMNNDATHNKSILMYQGQRWASAAARRRGDSLGDSPAVPPAFPNLPRVEYRLSAPGRDLLSRRILLNGVALALSSTGSFPTSALVGVNATTENMVVQPHTYGFAIYPDAAAPACE